MAHQRLCLACATIFDLEAVAVCPVCTSRHDEDLYHRVADLAHDVVYHGHLYRRKYEDNITSGDTRARYLLVEPSDVLVWLGITVLSGILGGASWDLVRAVAGRIRNSLSDTDTPTPDVDVLRNDAEEYVTGMANIDPAVRSAILEEILVHAAAPRLAEAVALLETHDSAPVNDPELVADAIAMAAKDALEKYRSLRSSKRDFEGLWSQLQDAVAKSDRG